MADNNRIVLAYSGGLDTSVAIPYLKDRTGKDVVAVSLDVGQGGESLETIKNRALACGAVEAYVVDARNEFANEYCMKALKANAMYEGVYPLVSAISRPLISKHLVRAAHQFGADTISHGCTGKGNDQVRFEVSISSIDPTLRAISPIRDLSLTRDVEIAFAKEHKLPITQTEKSPYSIDQNVWGRAIETGFLEDPWNGPTKDCYSYTDDPAFPPVEDEVVIEFKEGIPVKIDGRDVTPLQAIEEMNRRAGAQGIGRIDLIEDRLVGIKSRELYEAPGAVALITAHRSWRTAAWSANSTASSVTSTSAGVSWCTMRSGSAPPPSRSTPSSRTPRSTSPARFAWCCTAVAPSSPAVAPTARCTTTTSPPTTPATASTRSPPTASSTSTAYRPAWPPPATSSSATASRCRRTPSSNIVERLPLICKALLRICAGEPFALLEDN